MANDEKRGSWKLVVTPVAILATLTVGVMIYKWLQPDVQPVASCGNWEVPLCVEKELKGIPEVCKSCNHLKKTTVDTKMSDDHSEFCNDLNDVVKTINGLWPYEAENVEHLISMYTIQVQNNKGRKIKNLKLGCRGAQYIEVQKNNEPAEEYRDRDLVKINELGRDDTFLIKIWANCPVFKWPDIKITQDPYLDASIGNVYFATPLLRVPEWVNKYPIISLGLVFCVCLLCGFVGLFARKTVLAIRKTQAPPLP
jgi:hypothetical protein